MSEAPVSATTTSDGAGMKRRAVDTKEDKSKRVKHDKNGVVEEHTIEAEIVNCNSAQNLVDGCTEELEQKLRNPDFTLDSEDAKRYAKTPETAEKAKISAENCRQPRIDSQPQKNLQGAIENLQNSITTYNELLKSSLVYWQALLKLYWPLSQEKKNGKKTKRASTALNNYGKAAVEARPVFEKAQREAEDKGDAETARAMKDHIAELDKNAAPSFYMLESARLKQATEGMSEEEKARYYIDNLLLPKYRAIINLDDEIKNSSKEEKEGKKKQRTYLWDSLVSRQGFNWEVAKMLLNDGVEVEKKLKDALAARKPRRPRRTSKKANKGESSQATTQGTTDNGEGDDE